MASVTRLVAALALGWSRMCHDCRPFCKGLGVEAKGRCVFSVIQLLKVEVTTVAGPSPPERLAAERPGASRLLPSQQRFAEPIMKRSPARDGSAGRVGIIARALLPYLPSTMRVAFYICYDGPFGYVYRWT